MYIGQFIMVFVGVFRPFKLRSVNNQSLVNEFVVLTLTTIMVIFTEFCGVPETQYRVGWIYIGTVLVFIVISIVLILSPTFKSLYLCSVKYFRLAKHKAKAFFKKLEHKSEKKTAKVELDEKETKTTDNTNHYMNFFELLIKKHEKKFDVFKDKVRAQLRLSEINMLMGVAIDTKDPTGIAGKEELTISERNQLLLAYQTVQILVNQTKLWFQHKPKSEHKAIMELMIQESFDLEEEPY